MLKFIAGAVFGLMLGVAFSAMAAKMVGQSGTLDGWTVNKDGEEVCTDPEVDMTTQEINCD